LVASLIEPLSFQLLRHLGAMLGWWALFTGGSTWGHTAQRGLSEHHEAPAALLDEDESGAQTG